MWTNLFGETWGLVPASFRRSAGHSGVYLVRPCRLKNSFARLATAASRRVFGLCWASVLMCALAGCSGERATPTAEANRLLLEAKQFAADGKVEAAKEAFAASIAAEPTKWAYLERAKLEAEADDVQAAAADCDAALKLFPADPDLVWLREELKKPKEQRFQGRVDLPSSANR